VSKWKWKLQIVIRRMDERRARRKVRDRDIVRVSVIVLRDSLRTFARICG
jgi:hypothetical protein